MSISLGRVQLDNGASIEKVKAAAQADYERRILSAIETAFVSAEPLALAISRDRLRQKIASDPDLEVEVRSAKSKPDLAAENARLREALAPFAAEADEHDGASAIFSAEVPIAWLRAARAAHKGGAA